MLLLASTFLCASDGRGGPFSPSENHLGSGWARGFRGGERSSCSLRACRACWRAFGGWLGQRAEEISGVRSEGTRQRLVVPWEWAIESSPVVFSHAPHATYKLHQKKYASKTCLQLAAKLTITASMLPITPKSGNAVKVRRESPFQSLSWPPNKQKGKGSARAARTEGRARHRGSKICYSSLWLQFPRPRKIPPHEEGRRDFARFRVV